MIIALLAVCSVSAFFAGYQTGRRHEAEELCGQLDELLERLRNRRRAAGETRTGNG